MKKTFKPKSLKSGVFSKALTAGILACVLSCGAVMPVEAASEIWYENGNGSISSTKIVTVDARYGNISSGLYNGSYATTVILIPNGGDTGTSLPTKHINQDGNPLRDITVWKNLETGQFRYFASGYFDDGSSDSGMRGWELTETEVVSVLGNSTALVNAKASLGSGLVAGNGITISSDNKVSVKAGTNVTVDENGVSVTGNGSVSSGNTGLINGGTAYSELRPSANGNYVKYKNSI